MTPTIDWLMDTLRCPFNLTHRMSELGHGAYWSDGGSCWYVRCPDMPYAIAPKWSP